MHRKTCDRCNWMGFGWDTNPYGECRYYSRHFVRDRLNTHAHSHHYFCG